MYYETLLAFLLVGLPLLKNMIFDIAAMIYVVSLSGIWLLGTEKVLVSVLNRRLSGIQRILLPLPLILFLSANIDGIISFNEYMTTSPDADVYIRYPGNEAWNTERLFLAGVVAFLLIPLAFAMEIRKIVLSYLLYFGFTFLWVMVVFIPFLLYCKVPLQD